MLDVPDRLLAIADEVSLVSFRRCSGHRPTYGRDGSDAFDPKRTFLRSQLMHATRNISG
jgi:hypothetical protein